MGVLYDELHGFNLHAPTGWCCFAIASTLERTPMRCVPKDRHAPVPTIEVSYSYLSNDSFDAAVKRNLAARSPTSLAAMDGFKTRQKHKVQGWRATYEDNPRNEIVAYILQEDVCLVRLSLSSDGALTPSAEKAFQEFVWSYWAHQ
jgi:hypothetical protein